MNKVMLTLCVFLSCGMAHCMDIDKKNLYIQPTSKTVSFQSDVVDNTRATNVRDFQAAQRTANSHTRTEAKMENLLAQTKDGFCVIS